MKKISLYLILLFLLWIAHLVNLYIWLKLDANYLTYDAHRHLLLSLRIFEEYKRFSPDIFFRCSALTLRHPPLVMMVTAPFYFIFGRSQDAGVLINAAIFSGILIFAAYKIGTIIHNSKAGIFAVFILMMYPVVFNQLKVYMLDLPLTAIVSLSIYLLILSDNFKNLKYSLLLLIALISGMLIKGSFIIFLAPPLIYVFIKRLFFYPLSLDTLPHRAHQERRSPIILFFVLTALGILIILCSSYYFSPDVFIAGIGKGAFMEKFIFFLKRFACGPGYLQTWPTYAPQGHILRVIHAAVWYLWGFINWQVSFLFFIIFFIGAFLSMKHKLLYKDILFVWLIGSFFLLINLAYGIGINMEVSAVRYSMPLLPAVAIMSAAGIMKIPIKQFRILLITVTIIFGMIQFIFVSYPIGVKFRKIEISLKSDNKSGFFPSSIIIFNPGSWAVSGSDSGSHPGNFKEEAAICARILNTMESSRNYKKKIVVTVIPDDTRLWYLQYLTFVQNKPFDIICDWNYQWLRLMKEEDYGDLILRSDYIIDKEGGWQGEAYMQSNINMARNYFNLHKKEFYLLKELRWTDGAAIFIYKRELAKKF
ncbi:MAG: glycosyltransferase family 39 protein [Candidatus Omnitrophota bacterium]